MTQLFADRDFLILKLGQLGFLLGREDHLVFLALAALQFGQLALGVGQALLQLALLTAETFLGGAAHIVDRGERPLRGCAATDRDQVGRAAKIVDRVDDEIAVVGERVHDLLAEELLHLHPETVGQQVGVGNEDDLALRLRFGQMARILALGKRRDELAFEAAGDDEGLGAVGLVVDEQQARIGEEFDPVGRHGHRVGAGLDQRRQLVLRLLRQLEEPGGGDVDALQLRRGHVGRIEVALVEAEDRRMADRLALRRGHLQRVLAVEHDLLHVVVDAPGLEQLRQVGGAVGHHRRLRVVRIGARIVALGERVDEDEQMAAAQNELVDRVLRIVGQVLRLHDNEDVDVLVDRLHRRGGERAHFEQLLELRLDRPGLAHLPGLRVETRAHRQSRDQADGGLLRHRQLVDHLGDVVFEERLLVRVRDRHDRLAVGRVRADDAEKQVGAALPPRQRLQAERRGAVLVFGERQRIDRLHAQLAARARGHLGEHLAHARRVVAQRGGVGIRALGCGLVGEVQAQRDRLLDRAEDVLGSLRQGVEVVLGQVEARAAEQRVADQDHGDEQHRQDHECAEAQEFAIGIHRHIPEYFSFSVVTPAFAGMTSRAISRLSSDRSRPRSRRARTRWSVRSRRDRAGR